MTKQFNELGLSELALQAVEDLGYTEPTPVQEQAIPAVLAGRDVIAAAKTGTGKTAAFSLPLMDALEHARHGQGPLMLVVTPTRELAKQIQDVCKTIAKRTHHNITCVVGGVSYDPQKNALARGTDILIATPGRLIDLLNQGAANLSQVNTLVLDEADRMLDMGFLPDMKRIVAACPVDRQTLLFSATIDEGIEKNMAHLLTDPVFVEIAHKGETADTVDQYFVRVDQRLKNDLLQALLEEKGGTRIIVFARTRHRVDNCCRKLRRAGIRAEAIHSDRSQNQRQRALDNFAAGKVDVIVATDVLARGIDVSDVNYVVNLDLPTMPEDYVHRIGRTGRAGESGYAVSFVNPETESILHDIEKLIGKKIPEMEVESFDAEASAAAAAAKATRNAGRRDPELAQAAREYANAQKKKQRAQGASAEGESGAGNGSDSTNGGNRSQRSNAKQRQQQPRKTRGTAQKEGKKSQKQASGQDARGNSRKQSNASGSGRGSNTGRGAGTNANRNSARSSNDAPSIGPNSSSGDFRPGRSQRAQRQQLHNRSEGASSQRSGSNRRSANGGGSSQRNRSNGGNGSGHRSSSNGSRSGRGQGGSRG